MKKPDKYPFIDPRQADLYGAIIRAAQSLRSVRLAEDSGARAAQRDREVAARLALIQKEADEPVIWVSKENEKEAISALVKAGNLPVSA